ncbi:STM3941 family protein [Undibacterium sp. RuTC16W]|uniref:STM3941 family protein n=1 Tax=Undibacterium sp. RuTC16W TaxID=3413048 RepID=UPI003BF19EB0
MYGTDEKIIALDKKKLRSTVIISYSFIIVIFLTFFLEDRKIPWLGQYISPFILQALGVLCALFFIACAAIGSIKLTDNKPGLILNSTGLLDNSSGLSAGIIPWHEIVGFDVFQLQSLKILIIKVRDPQKYILRGNPLQRLFNWINFKLCDSPISITPESLNLNFEELEEMITRYHTKYGVK